MADRHVKGTMVIDFVRMIRANRDLDWESHLRPEDWDIIESRIYPNQWQPLDFYRRVGLAVFRVLAGGKLDLARQRGKERGKELFGEVYRSVVHANDPAASLDHFVRIYVSLFDFSTLSFEQPGEKHVVIRHDYDNEDIANQAYCHQLMGMFDALVEMAGGALPRVEVVTAQWQGAPETAFAIRWA